MHHRAFEALTDPFKVIFRAPHTLGHNFFHQLADPRDRHPDHSRLGICQVTPWNKTEFVARSSFDPIYVGQRLHPATQQRNLTLHQPFERESSLMPILEESKIAEKR